MIEDSFLNVITGRAVSNGIVSLNTVDIREFAVNSYGSVDDYTYGGGAGMLMMCEPVYNAYIKARERTGKVGTRVVYMTPQGEPFTQKKAEEFSKEEALIILCGHYEGIDERVLEEIVTDNISIGDYVLSGGELAALVVMDAVTRLLPGALGNESSSLDESFSKLLLEYPQYTRPAVWHEKEVPQILMSGDHKKVEQYRVREARKRTRQRRPELYEQYLRERGLF